jgi:hypothetical protein
MRCVDQCYPCQSLVPDRNPDVASFAGANTFELRDWRAPSVQPVPTTTARAARDVAAPGASLRLVITRRATHPADARTRMPASYFRFSSSTAGDDHCDVELARGVPHTGGRMAVQTSAGTNQHLPCVPLRAVRELTRR